MEHYVKIEWPFSQYWLNFVEYDDDMEVISDIEPGANLSVYVPEDLYVEWASEATENQMLN